MSVLSFDVCVDMALNTVLAAHVSADCPDADLCEVFHLKGYDAAVRMLWVDYAVTHGLCPACPSDAAFPAIDPIVGMCREHMAR